MLGVDVPQQFQLLLTTNLGLRNLVLQHLVFLRRHLVVDLGHVDQRLDDRRLKLLRVFLRLVGLDERRLDIVELDGVDISIIEEMTLCSQLPAQAVGTGTEREERHTARE